MAASAVGVMMAPGLIRYANAAELASQAASAQARLTVEQERQLKLARAYNDSLVEDGQRVLGDAYDPWSDTGSKTPIALSDKQYQSALNMDGDGLIGSIRVPKIDVDLPIRHGTTQDILALGAGHMYGTSLPVGGRSTHSVISAHRGLPKAALFTRLDEMRVGDPFYVHVAGRTLGYKVTRIDVIRPDQFQKLLITPDKDLVTLMTCTPYGVNTHRLLVTGTRATIGKDIPAETKAPSSKDMPAWQKAMYGTGMAGILLTGAGTGMACARDAKIWRRRQTKLAKENTSGGDDPNNDAMWDKIRKNIFEQDNDTASDNGKPGPARKHGRTPRTVKGHAS